MRKQLCAGVVVLLGVLVGACDHAEDIGGERPAPSRWVGAPCFTHSDCEQYCAWGLDFPEGFCTLQGCRLNDECPDGTVCIVKGGGLCVYPCSEPLDCAESFVGRSGYGCHLEAGYSTNDTTSVSYEVCIGT